MTNSMLTPAAVHALADAIKPAAESICDWCQRPFHIHKPRYAWNGSTYCSKACRDLDLEILIDLEEVDA